MTLIESGQASMLVYLSHGGEMAPHNACRVLVVEDEPLIGLDVATVLCIAGCDVAGPFRSLAEASKSISEQHPTAAVLDVGLAAEMAFPIADTLAPNGVPFIWLTGYPPSILPERHRGRPFIAKPFSPATLLDALASALRPVQFTRDAA
jgi:DNA-binding response OmpR family regulator